MEATPKGLTGMDVVTSVTFGRAVDVVEHDLLAVEVGKLADALAKLTQRVTALELPIAAPLPVIDMFSATPDSAEVGAPVILQWFTHDATAVALDAMTVEPNGSYQVIVTPGPGNNAWTLYASNADGIVVTKTIAITVLAVEPLSLPPPPVIEYFTATPVAGIANSVSRLAWKVIGAVEVQLGAMDVESEGTHNAIVSPFASGNVWVLQARNDGLSVMQELSIGLITNDPVLPPADERLPPSALVRDASAQPFRVGLVRYATLQSALDAMIDGDTLHVTAGTHFGPGGTLRTSNALIICDDGEAVFQASETAGLTIAAPGTIAENMAWECPNGAGIRWQKTGGANLTLRNCRFSRCATGLFCDDDMPTGTALIDGCHFDRCVETVHMGSGATTLIVQNSQFRNV